MYRHDSLSFTILAALFGLYTITNAQILDSPLPENFVRRSQVAATILGNYVYIEGGHIAQLQPPSGKIDPNQPVNIVNSTLSIDMSHSWSSSNVSIRTIPKPPQMQDRSVPSIWTDAARGEYYLWGGASQAGSKSKLGVEKDKTYKFTTDGSGGGSWSLDDSVPSDKQTPRLLRTQHAAYASTPRSAFAIGGIATSFGDVSMANNGNPGIQRQAVPGMIEFDFDSRQFTNLTDAPIAGSSIIGAQAEYIPNFGESNGLVIVLGGWQARLDDGGVYNINLPTFDFHNLTFFDPATKQKYWQATSGDVPPSPRMQFCSAGRVTADGKGYDLFIHGGLKQQGSRQTHLDAYILSLPGFFWTRVPQGQGGHTAVVESRSYHVCLPVGKRQILSIGGNRDGSDKWTPADSAPQGLLLFDMTSMQWKYDFDSEDEAYESAGVIREWYRRGSLDQVQWSSEQVKAMFATSENETQTLASLPDNKSSTPVGAIVGGVVGGLAGLAIAAGAAFWFVRRRRERNHVCESKHSPVPSGSPTTLELQDQSWPNKYAHTGAQETPAQHGCSEMPIGKQATELDATGSMPAERHELDGTPR